MKPTLLKITLILSLFLTVSCTSEYQPLVVGFWNVENLFDLDDDPEKNDEEFALGGRKNVTQEILDQKLENLAELLRDMNADVVGLAEVENLAVLEMLNAAYPARDYSIVHYESPDERGIDVALLYDAKTMKIVKSEAVKVDIGNPTRDILYVKGLYAGQDLHLFVNHWPSHWGGTEKTIPLRAETARTLRREVDKILDKNPAAEILIMGDLNDMPTDPSVQDHLGSTLDSSKIGVVKKDSGCSPEEMKACGGCPGMAASDMNKTLLWNLMGPYEGKVNGSTYKYRGDDKNIDHIIVSPGLADDKGLGVVANSIKIVDAPTYRQQEGDYAGYPFRFWAGNRLLGGYSDHMAVKVTLERR